MKKDNNQKYKDYYDTRKERNSKIAQENYEFGRAEENLYLLKQINKDFQEWFKNGTEPIEDWWKKELIKLKDK